MPTSSIQAPSRHERRFLCLWLPRLATDRLQVEGRLDAGPAATVQTVGNATYLAALNGAGQGQGLRPGMTLASARAICPALQTLPAEPEWDRAFLEDLALWCDRFTPLVALDGSDGIMLDIAGCAHLFDGAGMNGESAMMREAREGLAMRGVSAAAAVAATSGAAAALARYGGRPAFRLGPDKKLSDALSPLPVAALCAVDPGIGGDVLEGLARVGLRCIGDLIGLPRASLASRFGLALAGALDKALGTAPRPIDPRPLMLPYRVRMRFPDPIGTPEDIAAALERLLARLCHRLMSENRGCRRLEWTLYRADGSDQRLSIGTARPARDADRLARLFEEKLKTVEPGYGIDSMLLAAPVVEDFESAQDGLSLDRTAEAQDRRAVTGILDRLSNRLGSDNVFRLAPIDSHLPDRAQEPAAPEGGPLPWPETPARPLKLLNAPYPIDPLTGSEGGRAPTAFRIFGRRTPLRILRGPERITPEWWRQDARWAGGARDYFDVEDETGRRYWIYRDHATDPPTAAHPRQRWYLQGLF